MWITGEQAGLDQKQIREIAERLWQEDAKYQNRSCNDCGADPGEQHEEGCDVARCTECGGQRMTCDCTSGEPDVWTGVWPGVKECYENNWIAKLKGDAWVFDLNRAAIERQKAKR